MKYYLNFLRRMNSPQEGDGGGADTATKTEVTETPENTDELDPWSTPEDSTESEADEAPEPKEEDAKEEVLEQAPVITQPPAETQAVQVPREQPAAPSAPQKPKERGWGEMTPEELDKVTNRLIVTPELMESMGYIDATPQQVQTMQTFADKIAAHAVTIAAKIVDTKLGKTLESVNPIVQQYNQYQTEQVKNQFYEANPVLKGQEELVAVVAKSVNPRNADGSERSGYEVLQEVAQRATALLQKSGIQSRATQPAAAPKSSVPKPNTLSGTGRSSQTTQQSKPDGLSSEGDIWAD